MSFFHLPQWVIDHIDVSGAPCFGKAQERWQAVFVWSTGRLFAPPRKFGGLGVLNLRLFNLCLLAKWWWQLSSFTQVPWASLILHNYYQHNKFWDFARFQSPGGSHFWNGVHKAVEYFKLGVCFVNGDGHNIQFWQDLWIGEQLLATAFPYLYAIAWNKKASI